MVVDWFVVYDDFSIISSKNVSPEDVPIDGVQWILEFTDRNKTTYFSYEELHLLK